MIQSRRLAAALLLLASLLAPVVAAGASPAADRPLKIVVLGDSLMAGYGLPAQATFPVVLEKELKANGLAVEIVNAGVSGDTASGGLARLDWSVPEGTDGVILELGANDMLRGVDPATTKQALDSIVTRLKERGIAVLLAGMRAAPNMGPDYQKRFDAIFAEIAEKHGLMLYPFFLDGVAGDHGLNLPDGIHPKPEGVKLIVARMLPTVERFIASLPPRG